MLKGSCHLIFVLRAAICMFHEIMKDNPVVEAKTISSHFPGDNQKNIQLHNATLKKTFLKCFSSQDSPLFMSLNIQRVLFFSPLSLLMSIFL